MKKYHKGLTFGVFDLFHIGHLNLLRNAKELCDCLIVCISTDDYVRQMKDKLPIIRWEYRYDIVEACKFVDIINSQDETFTKKDAIELYRPDVLFVGDDWTPETYAGEGFGVPVEYLPHTDGVSTTILVNRIKQRYAD